MQLDALEKEAEAEFLDELRDTLSSFNVMLENVRSNAMPDQEALKHFRRMSFSIHTGARAVDLAAIKLVALRMDDYLGSTKTLKSAELDHIQTFVDKLDAIIDGDTTELSWKPEATAKVVRELPSRQDLIAEFGAIDQQNIEVLMTVPERAMASILEKELSACGYRVTNVRKPFDMFEQVIRTKPDLIIAAMELGPITGVDLACSFAAIPACRNIPFCLLTSYSWGHTALHDLPIRAALVRKGKDFGDDIADALSRFAIT
jgi:PleD family two-component response regulator